MLSHTIDRLRDALVHNGPLSRVADLLWALTELEIDADHAVSQASMWYMPKSPRLCLQRIRGRYLTRCAHGELDEKMVLNLLTTDHHIKNPQSVKQMRDYLGQAEGEDVIGDLRTICTPEVWHASSYYREAVKPLGFENALIHMWRLDDQFCMGATLWVAGVDDYPSAQTRQRASELFRLAQPLFETQLTNDSLGMQVRALTARQMDVLRLILAGLSEKEIAETLHRSRHTIHTHIKGLFAHFDVSSRARLMSLFVDESVLDLVEGGKGTGVLGDS